MLPEVFLPLPLDLVQREGWRGLWSCVRCTLARFIRGLGRRELLSCGELLLPFYVPIGSPSSSLYVRRGDGVGVSSGKFFFFFFAMFLVVSFASSLHAQRGGEAVETSECRSC